MCEITLKIKPKELLDLCSDKESSRIVDYRFLGVDQEGDFDPHCHPASEIDVFSNTPCLYKVRLKLAEVLPTLKNHVFASWNEVQKALVAPAKTKYQVSIDVTLHRTVLIEAENLRDAEDKVRRQYEDGTIEVSSNTATMDANFDAVLIKRD